jgi:hypothetical protein
MYLRRKNQKGVFPCVGRGESRWRPKPSPPPKRQILTQNRQIWSKSPSSTWSSKSRDMTCADLGQSNPFPLNFSMDGFSKKPFYQNVFGQLVSTLLQCQNLPASFLWAVWTIFPAYIVNPHYISRRGGKFLLSRCHSIPEATSPRRVVIKQEQSQQLQHILDSQLFVVFPTKVLLHTVYIFNIFNVDWG